MRSAVMFSFVALSIACSDSAEIIEADVVEAEFTVLNPTDDDGASTPEWDLEIVRELDAVEIDCEIIYPAMDSSWELDQDMPLAAVATERDALMLFWIDGEPAVAAPVGYLYTLRLHTYGVGEHHIEVGTWLPGEQLVVARDEVFVHAYQANPTFGG